MRNLSDELKRKTINYRVLKSFGFIKKDDSYYYEKNILDEFKIIIEIKDEKVTSKIIDLNLLDEYLAVDIKGATGEYVGKVKDRYENEINNFINSCTDVDIYKSKYIKEIIKYVKDKYHDDLEFLWEKFSDTSIVRNKQNNKWYLVFMIITKDKLGDFEEKEIEVIDIRYDKGDIDKIIDNKNIFPGFHMNKNSWITIILDDNIDINYVKMLIDNSYDLSLGEKKLDKKVYEYLTLIPKGKVVTYQDVAIYLGNPGLARVVGNILHKNPDGDKYPCYKVLNAKGELAEAFVFGGKNVQKQLLESDGVEVINNKVDMNKYRWKK